MNPTKRAFIWISAIAVLVFTLFAGFALSLFISNSSSVTQIDPSVLIVMLIWLAAFLLIFEYFLVKNFHLGRPTTGHEIFMCVYLSAAYIGALVVLAYWLAGDLLT